MTSLEIKTLRQQFVDQFRQEPIVAFAPGRINIIGEHTDYNQGFVFPAAINLGIAVAVQFSPTHESTIIASDIGESFSFTNPHTLLPLGGGGWANYAIGIIKELMAEGAHLRPFNLMFSGSIPIGSGLSSSAALENSLIMALTALHKLDFSPLKLALMAQRAEHNAVGVKCGIMDQYSSMFGQKDHALLLDCAQITSQAIPVQLEDYEIVLINTNVKHSLAESAYNNRRNACERVANHFGKSSLRQVDEAELIAKKDALDPQDYTKARFVLQENQRVLAAAQALQENNITKLGMLMFQSHEGLKNDYQVSCAELDFLVAEAYQSDLIVGARMMGGGFGGFTINLVAKGEAENFLESVKPKFQETFNHSCQGISVSIGDGARILIPKNHDFISARAIA